MTGADLLIMLKTNLDRVPTDTSKDAYLAQLLAAGHRSIRKEGIRRSVTEDDNGIISEVDDIEDANLLVMYAAWMFRKRADDNPAMPRMLRYQLNNRLFSQKAEDE